MEVLSELGIDWKMFLAQIFNFLILLWALKRFAYPAILKMLEERTARIEKGLADAKAAAQKLEEIGEQEKKVLAEAREAAAKLLKDAEAMAKKNSEAAQQKAREDAERLIELAHRQLAAEKAQMVSEAKAELSGVIIAAIEKILVHKIDAAKDDELIKAALRTRS
jgi:F-type H+-transporting ATPase subunit b